MEHGEPIRPFESSRGSRSPRLTLYGMAFLAIIAGCGGDSSSQLLETARLEERQNNQAHAMELYEQIIQAYPSSAAADEARTRLKALKAR